MREFWLSTPIAPKSTVFLAVWNDIIIDGKTLFLDDVLRLFEDLRA